MQFTYDKTIYTLIKQLIKFNGYVVTLTNKGIENTLVFVNLFAFVIVTPVKLIPWESVTDFNNIDGRPHIQVNVKFVQAGWLAKLILFIVGFHFGLPFVKPQVKFEEIVPYQHRFYIGHKM